MGNEEIVLDTGDTSLDLTTEEGLRNYLEDIDEIVESVEELILGRVGSIDNNLLQQRLLEIYIDELINRGIINISVDDKKGKRDQVKKLRSKMQLLSKGPNNAMFDTMLSARVPMHPLKVDLVIPAGYVVDINHGILKIGTNADGKPTTEVVCPYVVLPYEIVEDPADVSDAMLIRLTKWDARKSRWVFNPTFIPVHKLTSSREISILNKDGVIVLEDKQKPLFAQFIAKLMNANEMLEKLGTNIAVRTCGWTKKGDFFPYTTKDLGDDFIFVAAPKTTAGAIKEIAGELPVGSLKGALEVIEDLKDNPVFATVVGGCLASPLVPKLVGVLDESIGIDVYGKTTGGKTTIQKLAVDIIYGLGDELQMSWDSITSAGIWALAKTVNNLPFIMDDTHKMGDENWVKQVPHALINGKRGTKTAQIANSWESSDSTKKTYMGTILFNGEVSITTNMADDSAGVYRRVILINHLPFPTHYDSQMVEDLKTRARANRGHIAFKWIEHLKTIDPSRVVKEMREMGKVFHKENMDAIYSGLVTKASLVVWCIREMNKMFGTNINVDAAVKVMKKSMIEETENVHVGDKVIKRILNEIYPKLANRISDSRDYVALNWSGKDQEKLDMDIPGAVDVIYKKNKHLIITDHVFKSIVSSLGSNSSDAWRAILYNNGYIKDKNIVGYSRPKIGNEPTEKPRIYGIKLEYDKYKKLIPKMDEEE